MEMSETSSVSAEDRNLDDSGYSDYASDADEDHSEDNEAEASEPEPDEQPQPASREKAGKPVTPPTEAEREARRAILTAEVTEWDALRDAEFEERRVLLLDEDEGDSSVAERERQLRRKVANLEDDESDARYAVATEERTLRLALQQHPSSNVPIPVFQPPPIAVPARNGIARFRAVARVAGLASTMQASLETEVSKELQAKERDGRRDVLNAEVEAWNSLGDAEFQERRDLLLRDDDDDDYRKEMQAKLKRIRRMMDDLLDEELDARDTLKRVERQAREELDAAVAALREEERSWARANRERSFSLFEVAVRDRRSSIDGLQLLRRQSSALGDNFTVAQISLLEVMATGRELISTEEERERILLTKSAGPRLLVLQEIAARRALWGEEAEKFAAVEVQHSTQLGFIVDRLLTRVRQALDGLSYAEPEAREQIVEAELNERADLNDEFSAAAQHARRKWELRFVEHQRDLHETETKRRNEISAEWEEQHTEHFRRFSESLTRAKEAEEMRVRRQNDARSSLLAAEQRQREALTAEYEARVVTLQEEEYEERYIADELTSQRREAQETRLRELQSDIEQSETVARARLATDADTAWLDLTKKFLQGRRLVEKSIQNRMREQLRAAISALEEEERQARSSLLSTEMEVAQEEIWDTEYEQRCILEDEIAQRREKQLKRRRKLVEAEARQREIILSDEADAWGELGSQRHEGLRLLLASLEQEVERKEAERKAVLEREEEEAEHWRMLQEMERKRLEEIRREKQERKKRKEDSRRQAEQEERDRREHERRKRMNWLAGIDAHMARHDVFRAEMEDAAREERAQRQAEAQRHWHEHIAKLRAANAERRQQRVAQPVSPTPPRNIRSGVRNPREMEVEGEWAEILQNEREVQEEAERVRRRAQLIAAMRQGNKVLDVPRRSTDVTDDGELERVATDSDSVVTPLSAVGRVNEHLPVLKARKPQQHRAKPSFPRNWGVTKPDPVPFLPPIHSGAGGFRI